VGQKLSVPKGVIEALNRYGINYWIIDGELYLDGRQTVKIIRLCDEGRLPKYVCG